MTDTEQAGADRYQPRRRIDPPLTVTVFTAKLWGPQRIRWGERTLLWHRSLGLQGGEEIPGLLEELLITSVGDLVGRCEFSPMVGRERIVERMLLPWGTWAPLGDEATDRLRDLILTYDLMLEL